MRRAIAIQDDLNQINTVEDLTGVFESVASIKIARIRNRVVASKEFFAELWQTYSSLRVGPGEQLFHKGRTTNGRQVIVAVTTEGKLSGEIGNRVIDDVVAAYKEVKELDVVVLGTQGAVQLRERGVTVKESFVLPDNEAQFSVINMMATLKEYEKISVFYQTYESLRTQKVGRMELVAAVGELSDQVENNGEDKVDIVSSHDYIFEPGAAEIANYLESMMMGVALSQVLMESKLAQYASRFNAMNAAKRRAHELSGEYTLQYHRAKRAEGDERLKEIMKIANGLAI